MKKDGETPNEVKKTYTVYAVPGTGFPEMRLRPGALDLSLLHQAGLRPKEGDRIQVTARIVSSLEVRRRRVG